LTALLPRWCIQFLFTFVRKTAILGAILGWRLRLSKTPIPHIGGTDDRQVEVKSELELRHLRVFLTVVELGAHTRAARSLGMSQSTVSETVSALERTLGTALFRKATKGLMMTPSGEALLPYARRMVALTSELLTEVARVSTEVSATLVVSAVESLSAYVLPARLAALRSRWPNVRLEVMTGVCSQIRENVSAGKSDLGLVIEAGEAGNEGSLLARPRLIFVASPGHALAQTEAVPSALCQHEFYLSDAAGDYHQVLRRYFEAAQLPAPMTEALGSIEGVKRGLLVETSALGVLPDYAVEQELREGALVEICVTPALPGLTLRAVFAPGSPASPVVEDLLRSLEAGIDGHMR
jgi:DNA-binding transcriptional LysR family regulator